jgi:hypothetical protein
MEWRKRRDNAVPRSMASMHATWKECSTITWAALPCLRNNSKGVELNIHHDGVYISIVNAK